MHLKPFLCLPMLTLGLVFGGVAAGAQDRPPGYPPEASLEEVRALIDRAPRTHPRLLTHQAELAALQGSLEAGSLQRRVADAVIRQADALIDAEPITRTLEGRRLLGQARRCVQRVVALSVAYHLTQNGNYARRAEREMLAAARFADWNPSHFLDVAEMTFALAVGYDWLHGQLGDSERHEIRQAIVAKGVELPWTTQHHGWVRSRNNWGQVCHGGLTAGALAVMEDEPDLAARTVHNALQHVIHSMAVYAPKGSYPEGPGYWAYGTGYNVLLITLLESALGSDFGLSAAPGFNETGAYPSLVCGPSGLFFNYADGGAGRSPQPLLHWFAARFERPDWLWGELDLLEAELKAMADRRSASSPDRFFPFTLLWMREPPRSLSMAMPLHWSSEGETPITVHRSSWTDPHATFIGFKGGSPSANHGQMDIGSFVLDADGVRWAVDLGAEGYHGIESRGMNLWDRSQSSDRWKIFRQRNEGHNTLVIDGQLQRADAAGRLTHFSDDPAFPHSVLDLSDVYREQAGSVRRGVALLPSREVLIQDHLTGLKPGQRVRWGMITAGNPGESGQRTLRLQQGDAELELALLAPSSAVWRVEDTATPKHEWDSPNRGTHGIVFEAVAPDSGELVLAVLATPGTCRPSVRPQVQLVPLDQWGS
jgi:hypothetical protein